MISIRCTVRGCDLPLDVRGPAWRCSRGHAFDVGRSGYANLLQPQDRRSAEPGDSAAMVQARARWLDRGFAEPLFQLVLAWIDEFDSFSSCCCNRRAMSASAASNAS